VSANTCIGLEQNSIALCEQVSSLIDEEIIEIHGHVDKYTMNLITEAVKVQIGAYDKYNM
jgi:mRNA-degrading endonuclease toxin of MazEF toxin-antitoxin module